MSSHPPPPGTGSAQPPAQDPAEDRAEGPAELARQLAAVAHTLQSEPSAQEVMDRIVTTSVAMVPGAAEGTISLVRGRRTVMSAAASSDAARRFDRLQDEVGQGPCLDAMFEQEVVRVDDLVRHADRWPDLAGRADEVGMASMLCFQLYVDGDNLGGLNLLGRDPGAFDEESVQVGLLLAAHAAVAVAGAQRVEDLQRGLANRDVIGQAKGILMERFKITADQAFELLARFSQDRHRKLHEVAGELARSGELPHR